MGFWTPFFFSAKDVVNSDGSVDSDMVGMNVSASAASTAVEISKVGDGLRTGSDKLQAGTCSMLCH